MNLDLTSMFLLGLFGTGHCLGMCGPLVLAFPAATGRVSAQLFYHLGRTLTYTAIGTFVGGIGAFVSSQLERVGVDALSWIPRAQTGLTALAALIMLLFGLTRLGILSEPSWVSPASPAGKLPFRRLLRTALRQKSDTGMFLLGVIFGFLPCGLSVAAFARALASGGAGEAALLTASFAAGTLPGPLLLGTAASRAAANHRRLSDVLSGLIMLAMVASLVYRLIQPHGH